VITECEHDQDRARSASEIAQAALTKSIWLNACGKFPGDYRHRRGRPAWDAAARGAIVPYR